jgi:hypothetical protein
MLIIPVSLTLSFFFPALSFNQFSFRHSALRIFTRLLSVVSSPQLFAMVVYFSRTIKRVSLYQIRRRQPLKTKTNHLQLIDPISIKPFLISILEKQPLKNNL